MNGEREKQRMLKGLARVVVVSVALGASAHAQGEPLPIKPLWKQAVAQQPAIGNLALAPDGQHIAAIINRAEYKWPAMAVWRTDNPSLAPTLIPANNARPVSIGFLGNARLMFVVDGASGDGRFAGRRQQTVMT